MCVCVCVCNNNTYGPAESSDRTIATTKQRITKAKKVFIFSKLVDTSSRICAPDTKLMAYRRSESLNSGVLTRG